MFQSNVLEALRQSLESGQVTISRATKTAWFPARFQLVMAMNPCPCGRAGSDCSCVPAARRRYAQRLSAPIRDRIDIHPLLGTPGSEVVMFVVRQQAAVLFVAVGLMWAFRSLQAFSDPRFSDPQGLNDWVAVVTLSLATWLLAPSLLVLPQPPSARWPARTAAAAAVVVGLANLLEVGLGVEAAGLGFGLGNAVLLLGCVAMSLVCLVRSPRWTAVMPAATAVGLLLLENGGGLLCLAAWGFAAFRVTRA